MSTVIQMFKNGKDEKGSDTIKICTKKKKSLSLSQLLKKDKGEKNLTKCISWLSFLLM